ncbi:MAG TPA: SdrD B-like domain-containing protein, partial [Lacibacter sp.]|nr:SdrD B-like domain-containing protein [Lacibacter sp.]
MKQAIAQSRVVLPGNFQSELGCAGDWMPDGSCTDLTFNASSGNWEGSFTIPAGCYEYKVAINGSWNENYGLNGIYFGLNIPLNLAATGVVTFSYNPVTHIVTSSPLSGACPPSQIVLTGSFQSELGCAGDWYPNCSNTALTFNNTTGKWEGSFTIPAGCWEYRVNYNGGWNEYYGKNGVRSGENIRLYVATTSVVAFSFDPVTHIVTCLNNVEACMPSTVVIPGNFQSELGCAPVTYINGDWEPGCDFTRLTYNATTKLWEGTFNIPAGDWEFKVAYDNSWAENYGLNGVRGGANIPLQLCAPASITFKYNYITHLVELVAESATICINKFYDANVNGIQDYNEPPLPNVTFTLSGDAARTGTTDASGKITFTGLIPGNYNVTENIPSGYYATTATTKNISLELQM